MNITNQLDEHTSFNLGKKNHVQYSWSNNFHEKFVQLSFQLVRCSEKGHEDIRNKLIHLILSLKNKERENFEEFKNLFKLIGHTRDIISGKGEQKLSFLQILTWYDFYPQMAKFAFSRFVNETDEAHPFGSWKDVKYFANYIRDNKGINHELIQWLVELSNNQLSIDLQNYNSDNKLSLVAKWLPREKSKKFGWFNKILATNYYKQYMVTANTIKRKRLAIKKCVTKYRKELSKLNKILDTTQIKMTGQNWREIEHSKTTSLTIRKNKLAFINKTCKGKKRSDNEDRIQCSNNFKDFLEDVKCGKKNIHGRRCNIGELVKDAIQANGTNNKDLIDTVNLQWNDNKKNNTNMGNMIPMCDTSYSMWCDNSLPLYNSIGLSIRASECASGPFRNRVITFSQSPCWVKFTDENTFCEKVRLLLAVNTGLNTNFYAALKLILDVCIKYNISPTEVENMILAVFSDMQIDIANKISGSGFGNPENLPLKTMFEAIKDKYSEAGMKTNFKTPYKNPHILFWNLKKTNGFPTLSSEKNTTMISGYSSQLLNVFADKGFNELKKVSGYSMLLKILSNPRYKTLEIFAEHTLNSLKI